MNPDLEYSGHDATRALSRNPMQGSGRRGEKRRGERESGLLMVGYVIAIYTAT
jgi:hypothetical protein